MDYPEDFEVITKIFNSLYPVNRLFSMKDIIEFLEKNPEILRINADIKSFQGWQSAQEKDKEAGF